MKLEYKNSFLRNIKKIKDTKTKKWCQMLLSDAKKPIGYRISHTANR
jgi:hypothetical protein